MAKRRRVKPYARPTSFDSNVLYDIRHYQLCKYGSMSSGAQVYHKISGGDEIFHVVEGEILMRKRNSPYYSNGNLHCFSHANGLTKKEFDELEYVGVAVTGFAPEREVYEQGFVANFGGLNTLYNNSDETIKPGDLLVAYVPGEGETSKYQEGVPRAKCQFVPMEIGKALGKLRATGANKKSMINMLMNRVMGTALSYSRPKHTFDIILHKAVVNMTTVLDAIATTENVESAESDEKTDGGNEELMSETSISFQSGSAKKTKKKPKSAKKQ